MESLHVCVVDSSVAVRETVAIILSDGCVVDCLTPEEFVRDPMRARTCDALIVGDDIALGEAAAGLPPGVPVLWLHTGDAPPPFAGRRWARVPRAFEPQELRAALRGLLGSEASQRPAWSTKLPLEYPVFPRDVVALARQAGRTSLPVLLCGEVGTGKVRLARAIHGLGRTGRFVSVPATDLRATLLQAAAVAPSALTILVSDLVQISPDGQRALEELLDLGGITSTAGWHPVRLICATTSPFDNLAPLSGVSKDLFYRLSVLPISLPSLRERQADIRPLVEYLGVQLTRGLSRPPVSFTSRAMHRLEQYLWFGNLAELETVLTRTIALVQSEMLDAIDASDLLFGYGRIVPAATEPAGSVPASAAPDPSSAEVIDLVINELAHEFKNPMAMIKMLAQHLERLPAGDDDRQEVTRITTEAVSRMDTTLENLLQFTRFRAPAPERVAINALLAPCLTDLTPQLAERRLLLNYHPAETGLIMVDPTQIVYAFDNLLRVLARELREGTTLAVRAGNVPTSVRFEFSSQHSPIAAKLAACLGQTPPDQLVETPLGLVLARALIERNGGRLEIDTVGDRAALTVWLPAAEPATDNVSIYGKATRPHS